MGEYTMVKQAFDKTDPLRDTESFRQTLRRLGPISTIWRCPSRTALANSCWRTKW